MMIPPMGKTKTRTDHSSLWLTGRLDLRTSTGKKKGCVSMFCAFVVQDVLVVGTLAYSTRGYPRLER
jgi:hypothetical protein